MNLSGVSVRYFKWLAVALAGLTLAACSGSDDGPRWAELSEDFNNKVQTDTVWSTSVGDGVGSFVSGLSPVFGQVDGQPALFAASREGIVRAINPDNGDRLWQIDLRDTIDDEQGDGSWSFFDSTNARLSGGLVYDNGRLFLGTENGFALALNADNGEEVWQRSVGAEIMADPAIGGGAATFYTSAGIIWALDINDGSELWRADHEVPALTLRGTSTPTYLSGGVLVGTPTGKLAVYVIENGQLAWEAPIAQARGATELERVIDVDAKPVVVGGTGYIIAYNGQLVAVELNSGRVIWEREYESYRNLSIQGNQIYVTDSGSRVYRLDRRSGSENWSNNDLWGRQLTVPVVHKKHVVVGDFEGYLHWFNRETGELEGRLEIDGDGAYLAPIVYDGDLFVQLRDGELRRIRVQ